jgi:hypothetical protein
LINAVRASTLQLLLALDICTL